jgi:signal transduction histidine kinase
MQPETYLIIHNIISAISIIALCGMAIFLFVSGKNKGFNKVLGATMLFVIIFALSHLVGVNIIDPYTSKIVLMFNLSMFFIASTNIHAVLILIKKEVEYRWFILFLYASSSAFVILFIIFPDLFLLPSESKMYFPNYYVPGALNWIRVAFMNVVAVPYMLYKLAEAYSQSKSNIDKNHYKYFFIIIIVAYAIGFMTNLLVYNIMVDPIWGMSFAFIFSIPFIYATIKYELFYVKIIAKNAFIYSLSIGIVGIVIIFLNSYNRWISETLPYYPYWITALMSSILIVSISIVVWEKLRKGSQLKYEFITTVTHKFRTPLTGIKWATDNLSEIVIDQKGKEQINYIKTATEKLVELTDLLVTLPETNETFYSYNLTKNNIGKMTGDIVNSLDHQIKVKEITIETNFEPDLFVNCDKTRVKFVIQTLIENSIQYSKNQSGISISISSHNNFVTFSVSDTGIGMTGDEIGLLFSKFYRTASARTADTEGMGIGLYVSKEIIKRHNGKIWVESDGPEKGSTFFFTLPMTK